MSFICYFNIAKIGGCKMQDLQYCINTFLFCIKALFYNLFLILRQVSQ